MTALKTGDLVKVKTKHEGEKLAVVVSQHFSPIGIEWKVKRLDSSSMTICFPSDLEVISAGR